jgi:hypothetical protein
MDSAGRNTARGTETSAYVCTEPVSNNIRQYPGLSASPDCVRFERARDLHDPHFGSSLTA